MSVKKSALGRGLGALIDSGSEPNRPRPAAASIAEIDLNDIVANPWQPRTHFDEERLQELSISIKELGIVQPLTVRKMDDGKYQLIAGERRFRASKLAGLAKVPAYVRNAEDDIMLEMALVENIQREDLDPIEIGLSYQRLIDECNLTQEALSEKIGKQRSTVTNYIRLLKLPPEIQLGLREKQISMGHARAIIAIKETATQLMIFEQIIKYDFSVRKVEEIVREIELGPQPKESKKKVKLEAEYKDLKNQISTFFHTNVQFSRGEDGKGKIVIPFRSDDELEKIIHILDKAKQIN